MREALDEARGHRLFGHQHDNRALGRRLLHRLGDEVVGHHKDIDVAGGEVGDERGHALEVALGVSPLNRDRLSFDIAQRTQALRECLQVRSYDGPSRSTKRQNPDRGDLPRWRCRGGERRYEQTQDKRAEASSSTVPHRRLLASASCRPSSFR
jgi:hypothetical protein